jgi:X-X-X-Leu-X-X-Gly heptad repeat protein
VAAFSIGRHAVSYTAGAATAAAGIAVYGVSLHYVTGDQANAIVAAFNAIANGVKSIADGVGTLAGGVSTLVGVAMAAWAAHSISPKQAASVAAECLPDTTIVTTQKIACSTPNQPNIVSNEDHVVVPGL